MKPSLYNFYQSSKDNTLIYNTVSGNCVVIPKKEYVETSNDKLVEMGFYVQDDKDELEDLITKGRKHLSNTKYNKYRVLTTTACNARCHYCYEYGVQTVIMDFKTAEKIADFIISENKNSNLIVIEWFGGEPLLNTEVIDIITNKILKCKSKNTKYESYMVSNGSLLTNSIIDKMESDWNIKRIQITLDGVGKNYEKVKGFPKGTFENIIDNIRLLSKKRIKINIRLNFDQNNMDDMKDIVSYLAKLDFKERLNVYPAPIFNAIPKTQSKQHETDIKNAELQMYEMLHMNGLLKSLQLLPHIMPAPCAASKPGYFTVNANGDIFKCDRQFLSSNKVGSVLDTPYLNKDVSSWSIIKVRPNCQKCKMFPLCWGGCIYEVMAGVERCHFSEKIIQRNLAMLLDDYESKKIQSSLNL